MRRKTTLPKTLMLSLALLGAAATVVGAQEEPLSAGEGGIPKPKRTKTVKPEYPADAQAHGIRGIVILQVTVDTQGKVVAVDLIRSVAGLDEAAVAAARQWEYEVTKIDGKAVSVRFPEVITFALKLPEIARQAGIPELRMGATPAYPKDGRGSATVTAEVALDAGGQVAEAQIVKGDSPFSDALLQALRTWRFATERSDEVLSFRLEAKFVEGEGDARGRVEISLSGLRRSEHLAPVPPVASAPSPAPGPEAAAPSPGAATAPPPAPPPVPAAQPSSTPLEIPSSTAVTAPAASASPVTAAPASPPPPPVEVITAPTRPAPPTPEPSGVSAIRDVALEPNVPDLTRGRRPVPPPFARMGGLSGKVEVLFSVDAAGQARVKSASGPELLRVAAEDTVSSWVFRRTTADRLHLVATIEYKGDVATATVKAQAEEPAAAPSAEPSSPGPPPPTVPPPSPEPSASPSPAKG